MRRGSERAGRLTDSTNACGVGEVEWNVGYAPSIRTFSAATDNPKSGLLPHWQ